jgi:hypothetical protein
VRRERLALAHDVSAGRLTEHTCELGTTCFKVELSNDDLGVLFTCFDLARWDDAITSARTSHDAAKLELLRSQTRKMFTCWKLNGSMGVRELESAAHRLVPLRLQRSSRKESIDNRIMWAMVLQLGWLLHNESAVQLEPMIRTYLVATDSTCGIERDLGSLKRVLDAHTGPTDEDGQSANSRFA